MDILQRRHLGVFSPPFIDLILDGRKTIESRFTKVRCAPYGIIKTGDVVLMKDVGGPVRGEFQVSRVEVFTNLTESIIKDLAREYGAALCSDADPEFWEHRNASKYATFMYVSNPIRYHKPQLYPKRDRRGWVVLYDEQYSLF